MSRKRTTLAGLAAALLLWGTAAPAWAAAAKIAVLISHRGAPFEEALEGFKGSLRRQGVSAEYDQHFLETDPEKTGQALLKIKKGRPDLVFTLGSLGSEAALKEFADIPVVTGMAFRPDVLKKSPNATGAFLEFPAEAQLRWLQRLLPDARTAGVIYNPRENRERIETAAKTARRLGLRLEASEVRAPQELPGALHDMSRSVDVLWGVADDLVLNPQTGKHILLWSFRNLVPFAGLSSAWVKAGALYAVEADYADNGAQCGEMAARALRGTPVQTIAPALPRKTALSLNLTTARHMKIQFPDRVVQEARHTY